MQQDQNRADYQTFMQLVDISDLNIIKLNLIGLNVAVSWLMFIVTVEYSEAMFTGIHIA